MADLCRAGLCAGGRDLHGREGGLLAAGEEGQLARQQGGDRGEGHVGLATTSVLVVSAGCSTEVEFLNKMLNFGILESRDVTRGNIHRFPVQFLQTV